MLVRSLLADRRKARTSCNAVHYALSQSRTDQWTVQGAQSVALEICACHRLWQHTLMSDESCWQDHFGQQVRAGLDSKFLCTACDNAFASKWNPSPGFRIVMPVMQSATCLQDLGSEHCAIE